MVRAPRTESSIVHCNVTRSNVPRKEKKHSTKNDTSSVQRSLQLNEKKMSLRRHRSPDLVHYVRHDQRVNQIRLVIKFTRVRCVVVQNVVEERQKNTLKLIKERIDDKSKWRRRINAKAFSKWKGKKSGVESIDVRFVILDRVFFWILNDGRRRKECERTDGIPISRSHRSPSQCAVVWRLGKSSSRPKSSPFVHVLIR